MKKGKRRYTKKEVNKVAGTTLILVVLVCMIAYVIVNASWLRPKLNEVQASYISLNNPNATDMLKVTALHKLPNDKGTSHKNKAVKDFQITGQQDSSYQIVLYHIGNLIDNKYVHYSLIINNKVKDTNILSNMFSSENGGIVIYDGKIEENNNCILRMWVDNSYQDSVKNVSYEVRIK